MYLLTLTMLIIAVLGTYVQVLGLQAARAAASQTALAQAMVQWHNNALAQVQNNMGSADISTAGANGCSLTLQLVSASLPACTNMTGTVLVYNSSAASGPTNGGSNSSPDCATNSNAPLCKTSLPLGYNSKYQFYSAAYQITTSGQTQNLVMTFLVQPAANVNPPFLSLASGQQTSFTEMDLHQQFVNIKLPYAVYGVIKNGVIVTQGNSGTPYFTPIQYPLPTSPSLSGLANNTLVIVSSPDFAHCQAGQTYHQVNGTCS
jgi:hypothetical protein